MLVRWGPPALLTIAAVPVSLYKLGSAPMWNDETASVSISVQRGHAFWSAVASDGGSMSAYYLLLHGLFLAGLAESPVSVRLVSVVAFVATVPFLYGLVLRCFGARIAALATALVVTNRTVIAKAQEARGYTLGLFLVVAGTWFLTSGVARSSRSRFAAWAVTFAVACYSLLLTPLFAASQLISLGTLRRRSAVMRWAAMAIVLLGVLLVPLVLLALHRGTAQIDWIPPISAKTVDAELVDLLSSRFPIWLRWPMFVAIALGAWKIVSEARSSAPGSIERWHRVLLLCWAALPLAAVLLISFAVSLLQGGYLISAIPSYAILAAVGITTAVELVVTSVSKLRARGGNRCYHSTGMASSSSRDVASGFDGGAVRASAVLPLVGRLRDHSGERPEGHGIRRRSGTARRRGHLRSAVTADDLRLLPLAGLRQGGRSPEIARCDLAGEPLGHRAAVRG